MKNYSIMALSLLLAFRFIASAGDKKPNAILIYTDDYGYTDLGVHGIDKHVDTPIMDQLARGGAFMTAGYSSAPQCVPSWPG